VAVSEEPRGVHLPSIDVLFSSMAGAFGPRAMGIIMTGMGNDGVRGLAEMKAAGAITIAQDGQSCAVFGMPGEAVREKAASLVLSPAGMASFLVKLLASLPPDPQVEVPGV
jgi:two-component system chemotaxis response regulator CheB